jgi:hypothetical protein
MSAASIFWSGFRLGMNWTQGMCWKLNEEFGGSGAIFQIKWRGIRTTPLQFSLAMQNGWFGP